MNSNQIKIKPFIKWVGGKSKLSTQILSLILKFDSKIYCEPFIGGGAILFEILNQFPDKFEKYIINDINTTLINTYSNIKNNIEELINYLQTLEKLNDKDNYLKLRNDYNNLDESVYKSALFIYLNKTCFRGLYRVNKSNQFNVPYANYKTLNFDYNNLINIHEMFNRIDIEFHNVSYLEFENSETIYYLDPPYYETFNDYSSNSFDSQQFYEWILLKSSSKIIFSNSIEFSKQFDLSMFDILEITINDSINSKNPNNKRTEILCSSKI